MAKALEVSHLWKQYRIRREMDGTTSSLKEMLNRPFSRIKRIFTPEMNIPADRKIFWALKDVSFSLNHGESLGIIGRNGAGKSTLLKIIARISRPTKGKLTLYERVTSLLEIGTGFNTELSGRDNVYLNGSFLGLRVNEIRKKFDDIVDFSEIGQFIDTPVKYYSSGMFVRLAFSVAAHLEPELLLLDEVLAVGDYGFMQKSTEKMKELLGSGATIILISHNHNSILDVCKRSIWLENGAMIDDGPSETVVDRYLKSA